MCRIHRIPFSPALVLQQVAPPYTVLSILQVAAAVGLKTSSCRSDLRELAALSAPYLAVLRRSGDDGDKHDSGAAAHVATADACCCLALVLSCDTEQIVYVLETQEARRISTIREFQAVYFGTVLLFARREEAARDVENDAIASSFGFNWFVPELLKYKKIWRDVLLASLAIQLMALATPLFTQVVIDKVIAHRTSSTLVVIGVGMFMFMLFTAGMTWIRQYLILHTGNRIDAVLVSQVFDHLFKLPLPYFQHRPTGTLVARVQGVETIRSFLSGAAVTLVLDVPFLFIFLALMFYYSWVLSLLTLALLAVIVTVSAAITPILRRCINHQFLTGARNQAFITEYVSGVETVKALQMEPRLSAKFSEYLASYLQATFNTRQLCNTYSVTANSLEQLLTLSILCGGAWIVMTTNSMTIGMLVAFQMFASRLSAPVLRMVGLWQEFQQASIAVARLADIMNVPAEPYSAVPSRADLGRGEIEMSSLSFRYADNLPFLYRGFSLAVAPGQCIAIMGPSGCGKSTLAKLLQGFYQPSDGSICIDGYDIRHLSANELRQHFGVVPQETTLFSGTIYDNLVLGNPHASFEQVVQASRLADIHDTIERLPEGYQTWIGEHGVGLSGGQKQRIAIARALLKRPKILIFDEATSSLDALTSENFARTVNKLKGKVTLVFIAHQLPKGLQVDRVVMLGGREMRMTVVAEE